MLRIAVAAAVLVAVPVIAWPQPIAAGADELKAAYLHKFARYVEWPDSAFAGADAPIVFGVVGAEAVYAELARLLQGPPQPGRAIVAKKLAPLDPLEGIHVLFVGGAALSAAPWQQRVQGRPILLVSDRAQALESGAALNFVLVQNRLRFEASIVAIEHSGLRVSSRLLALAQRVVGSP
ncbi:YfiR family protein [Piscinibacter koreensis]|uniref:YfiR family protein n=1 Tax=Piscinibacter koreensis TaxID=2742824 RepID=UPI00159241F9|nr:YfiR family protein [Schlegelella koreensis]